MTRYNPLGRRTALQTIAGVGLPAIAGCLGDGKTTETPDDSSGTSDGQNTLKRVAVDGTTLVVELTDTADVDQINLIQPNGEPFGTRDVAVGTRRISFEIGTSYDPGEYRVLALKGKKTVVGTTIKLRPDIQILDVGLYRNNPDKPWDEVYGESVTDRRKNGEAFVTVRNTGSGSDAIVELRFSGDVPNPIDNPRGSGIYETEQVVVAPGETADLFTNSFPFGTEREDGMGCSQEGNRGKFTTIVETKVGGNQITSTCNVQYTGSNDMTDCEVTITEA